MNALHMVRNCWKPRNMASNSGGLSLMPYSKALESATARDEFGNFATIIFVPCPLSGCRSSPSTGILKVNSFEESVDMVSIVVKR